MIMQRLMKMMFLRVFVEQGESAKFANRTQLVELIDFCGANKRDMPVCDRLENAVASRGTSATTSTSRRSSPSMGWKVVSVTEPIDPNPEGRLMETILAGFTQVDNDIRATRTVQGMRRK